MGSLISASALSSDAETRWRMLLPVRGSVSGVAVSSMMHDGATRLSTSKVEAGAGVVRLVHDDQRPVDHHQVGEGVFDLAGMSAVAEPLQVGPVGVQPGEVAFQRLFVGVDVAAFGLFDAQRLDGADDDADAVGQVGRPDVVDVGDVEDGHAALERVVERLAVGVGRVLERVGGLEADGVGGHQPEDDRELFLDVAAGRHADGVRRDDGLAAAGGQAQADVGHGFQAGHAAIPGHAAVRIMRHRQECRLRIVRQPGLLQVARQHDQGVGLEGFEFDGHALLVRLRCVQSRGGFFRRKR